MPSCNFDFLVEMGFHHVGQAGLELLISSDLLPSASPSAGITGMNHCTRPFLVLIMSFLGDSVAYKSARQVGIYDPRLRLHNKLFCLLVGVLSALKNLGKERNTYL